VLCHTTPGLAFSVDMSLDSVESIELSSPYLQAFGLSSLYLQALAETMPMRNNDELHRQFTDVGRASATKKLVRSLRQLANDVSEAYSRMGGLVQNLSDAVEVWHSLYFIFEVTVCLALGPFPSMSRNVLILLLALCDQLGSFWRRVGKAQGAVVFRGEHCTSTFRVRRFCSTKALYIGQAMRYESMLGSDCRSLDLSQGT
jgi:hypothetical protein